jgi:DNA-binding transcriptional LysR family regulator
MDLKQLQAFHAIVSSGSFGDAAHLVHLTPSALSHQIRKLEEELGQRLLIRAKPRVYPTPAGHILLASANRMLAELAHVKEHFGLSPDGPPRGSVRVTATNVGLCYLYGDLCERFMARWPEVELTITATETTEDAVVKVSKRAADVAFTTLPIDLSNLESVELGRAEQVFIVGTNHSLAERPHLSLKDVQQCMFMRYLPGSGGRVLSDQVFLPNGGYPPIMTESNDTDFVKRVVAMGLAVALVPAFTLVQELRSRRVRALRLAEGKVMQPFGFVHCKDLKGSTVDLFKSLCLDQRGPRPIDLTLETIHRSPWVPARRGRTPARRAVS